MPRFRLICRNCKSSQGSHSSQQPGQPQPDFSQTPAAWVLSLPVGCKPFLLLSGLSQTTELQATIKLLRGGVGTWSSYGAKAIGPELLRFQDLAPKLLYCADRQVVGPAFLFHGLEAFCLYLEPTVVMGSGQ